GPVRALAHAAWAVLRWCARVVMACARGCARVVMACARGCARVVVACARLLLLLGRPLRPCGPLGGRIAPFFLLPGRFLPAGFRLTVGGWLASARPSAPSPPTTYGRNR